MSCPRKIFMRGAKAHDGSFCPSSYNLASNSVNLQKISCNSGVTVPIQLLAIEESKDCSDVCTERPGSDTEICEMNHDLFAHIYITTENSNLFIKHYIVVFVERTKIGRYEELIKILLHTIEWLKIKNERPYFYIYYYGKQPVITNELAAARNRIIRTLRLNLNNYKKEESFCRTSNMSKEKTENFTISSSNPYQFNIS